MRLKAEIANDHEECHATLKQPFLLVLSHQEENNGLRKKKQESGTGEKMRLRQMDCRH